MVGTLSPGLSRAQTFEHDLCVVFFGLRAHRQRIFAHWIEFIEAFWLPLYTCSGEQQKRTNGKSTKCVQCSRVSTIRWLNVVCALPFTHDTYLLGRSHTINVDWDGIRNVHCYLFWIKFISIVHLLSSMENRGFAVPRRLCVNKKKLQTLSFFCQQTNHSFFVCSQTVRCRHRLWMP